MNPDIDTLSRILAIVLGVALLVVTAVLIYICWLWIKLHRELRRFYGPPEVTRDGNGKPIRERL